MEVLLKKHRNLNIVLILENQTRVKKNFLAFAVQKRPLKFVTFISQQTVYFLKSQFKISIPNICSLYIKYKCRMDPMEYFIIRCYNICINTYTDLPNREMFNNHPVIVLTIIINNKSKLVICDYYFSIFVCNCII